MDDLYIETARRQLRVIWSEDPGIQLVQRAPLVHPIERQARINEKGEGKCYNGVSSQQIPLLNILP